MQKHQSLLEMVCKSNRIQQRLKRGLTEIGGKEKRSRSIRDFKLGLEHRMRSHRQDQVVRLAKDLFCKRPQHKPPEALPPSSPPQAPLQPGADSAPPPRSRSSHRKGQRLSSLVRIGPSKKATKNPVAYNRADAHRTTLLNREAVSQPSG